VGVALRLYGLDFEHRPWSVFGDGDKIAAFNPLRRVPTLICNDGVAIWESGAILDYLDDLVGRDRALVPASGPARRDALRIAALACGLADKAVSLFYEQRLHDTASDIWVERCRTQIGGTLALLERERAAQSSPYWGGEAVGHADIATACAFRFVTDVHAAVIDKADYPAITALWEKLEATPEFTEIQQGFNPPA
jgi:glutathione S-transferase